MENTNNEAAKKDVKGRSRLYPRYDLEEAIIFITLINRLGGSRISVDAVAADMGKAINNSTFIGRVSCAKQFGLITQESGKISISSLGKEIVFPREESSGKKAIRTAFTTPQLYRELTDAFQGKVLPEISTLGNLLFHDYGIEANAKDAAAKNFLRSAEHAGVIQNGILVMSQQEGAAETIQEKPGDVDNLIVSTKRDQNVDSDTMHRIELALRPNAKFILIIPRDMSVSECDMLKSILSSLIKKDSE